jgi:hypothetical protein
MSASLTLDITSLRRQLTALPVALTSGLGPIIIHEAELMAGEVRTAYPRQTGNLQDHVTVERQGDLRARVKASARHAHLYEYGTVRRYTGTGAYRGTMPARPTFVPAAVRRRARLLEEVQRFLYRQRVPGFEGTLA